MTIYVCHDCGFPSAGLLCSKCTKVADAFGLSVDQRLAQLGVFPLADDGEVTE